MSLGTPQIARILAEQHRLPPFRMDAELWPPAAIRSWLCGVKWNEYRSILRNRDLVLLVTGRSVSWFGNALAPMALVFAALDLGASVGTVSLVVVARSLPQLLFVLVGGTLADRLHRRRVLLVGASATAMLSQGALGAALLSGHGSIAVTIGLSVVNGIGAAIAGPTAGAMFRAIVPAQDWKHASVLDRGGMQLGLLLGLAAGGMLIGACGPGIAIAVDAATFGFAGACYVVLRDPGPPAAGDLNPKPTLSSQLHEGFRYVRSRSWLIVITSQTLLTGLTFAAGLQVLAPLVADRTFGRAGLGVAGSLQVAGALLGVLLAGALPVTGRLRRPVLLNLVLIAPVLILAVGPSILSSLQLLVAFAIAMLATGCALELAGIWKNLIILRHVDPAMIGRVGSYSLLASVGGLPLGEALAGPLHATLGISGSLVMLAVAVALLALVGATLPSTRSLTYGTDIRDPSDA